MVLLPSTEWVLTHVSNTQGSTEGARFPFPVCSLSDWWRGELWTGESCRGPHAVMDTSRGASLPQMSNSIYFILGFLSGTVINQFHSW